jgi:putative PIN family toxin of toxin-antitoxin system
MLPTESVTRAGDAPRLACTDSVGSLGPGKPQRVVLDTNTVLDWLVFRDAAACRVGEAIASGDLIWLVSPRMLAELGAVLSKPFAPRWDAAREHALTSDVSHWATRCDDPVPGPHPLVCRDPDDQVFIDLARACSPALLLTRDRALLALRRRAAAFGVTIATAATWQQGAVGPGTPT